MDITLEEKKEIKRKTAKPLLWISMVSMVMIFAGLTSGYVVRRADGEWMTFELPSIFYISTLLIILSSITMLWTAMEAKKKDNNVTLGLAISLALGLAFGVSQFYAWNELTNLGIFFTGDGVSASGSFIYAITGMHLAHVVGGIIALIVSLINSIRGEYSPENKLGLELTAIFWHFLDLLWVYLFLFLLFIR